VISRRLLLGSAAAAATLGAPRIGHAAAASELLFVPQSDLVVVDPIWTTTEVTRNHGFMIFDQLYGLDSSFTPHPQMVAGHQVSADKLQWDLTLREGLKFHDDTPVLARDAVASIRRWASRDGFGRSLLAATEELSAPDDRTIRFRLKRPFASLPMALATPNNMCCIMPERLAKTDAATQVTDMVGSGPFRFVADERIAGSRVVYRKFDGYVPRPDSTGDFAAASKQVHFDRVVWNVLPDSATAAAAMTQGEFDWWENPTIDLLPVLKRSGRLTVAVKDQTGQTGVIRFNHLHPPFDNPAIRRIVLSAVNQFDCMAAYAGDEPSLIETGVGLFSSASPFVTKAGMSAVGSQTDFAKLAAELKAAGYGGEPVVFMAGQDSRNIAPMALVVGDMLKRMGFNVDYQAMDWGAVVQRRNNKALPAQGGWNAFCTYLGGLGNILPAANIGLTTGAGGWAGWWNAPEAGRLVQAWFDAPDLAAQKAICDQLQEAFMQNPAYAPLGLYQQPTCFKNNLTDVQNGFPVFWGVKRNA
jgi:peptide/nickel transport system substrate-binding protein